PIRFQRSIGMVAIATQKNVEMPMNFLLNHAGAVSQRSGLFFGTMKHSNAMIVQRSTATQMKLMGTDTIPACQAIPGKPSRNNITMQSTGLLSLGCMYANFSGR